MESGAWFVRMSVTMRNTWSKVDVDKMLSKNVQFHALNYLKILSAALVASVAKAASNQPDVITIIKRNSVVMFDEAKQHELSMNKAIVLFHTTCHWLRYQRMQICYYFGKRTINRGVC